MAYSLLLLLLEKVASLHDTRVEERPILHDKLDILDGQVDEHTSDLWGLWSNNLGDVLVEDSADLILVVGVLGYDSRDDRVTGHQVALLDAHLRHLLLLNHVVVHVDLWALAVDNHIDRGGGLSLATVGERPGICIPCQNYLPNFRQSFGEHFCKL